MTENQKAENQKREVSDAESIREPNEKERSALNLLGPNFMDELLAGKNQKERKVIGTGYVDEGNRAIHTWIDIDFDFVTKGMPDGTPIEIVAFVDSSKSERELVRPKGVILGSDKTGFAERHKLLFLDGNVIAGFLPRDDGAWDWCASGKTGCGDTIKLAQRAAEETLADSGLYGFAWKVVE